MTRLSEAKNSLEEIRSTITTEILSTPGAPDKGAVATQKTKAEAAGEKANTLWLKRAFDWTTGLFVALAGVAVVVPGLVRDKTTECPGGRASCGYDVKWDGWGDLGSALAWAAIVTCVAILFISIVGLGRSRGGLIGLAVGADNRLSTSKFQVLIWTVAVVFAFFFFVFQLALGNDPVNFDSLNGEYLLLLGGPFAAAILAKQAATSRIGETEQQVPALKPEVGDLVQDNSENGAVSDVQFLLFNFVAMSFFITAIAKTPTALPDLPDTLVGLTSISALTYLGAKLVGNNLPAIESVSLIAQANSTNDGKLRANSQLRILGRNFVPLSKAEQKMQTVVLFGAIEQLPSEVSDREILVQAPSGLSAGPMEITVRTSAGAVADPPWTKLEYTA